LYRQPVVFVVIAAIALVAYLVWYAVWTARRLDRLHAKVDAAAAALDAQLIRRSAMAAAFGVVIPLSPEIAVAIASAASEAAVVTGLGHDREGVENGVTRALWRAVTDSPESFAVPSVAVTEMHDEALRASFARRFYNDAVRDALTVRERRVVRWLRLAGRAPHPVYFEMEDEELPLSRISVAPGPTIET
jgi:hypothetical protein